MVHKENEGSGEEKGESKTSRNLVDGVGNSMWRHSNKTDTWHQDEALAGLSLRHPGGNIPSVTSPALPGHLSTAPGVTQQSSRGRCRWFYTWDCTGSFLLSVLVSTWSDRLGRGKWWLPARAWGFPKKRGLFLGEDPP